MRPTVPSEIAYPCARSNGPRFASPHAGKLIRIRRTDACPMTVVGRAGDGGNGAPARTRPLLSQATPPAGQRGPARPHDPRGLGRRQPVGLAQPLESLQLPETILDLGIVHDLVRHRGLLSGVSQLPEMRPLLHPLNVSHVSEPGHTPYKSC